MGQLVRSGMLMDRFVLHTVTAGQAHHMSRSYLQEHGSNDFMDRNQVLYVSCRMNVLGMPKVLAGGGTKTGTLCCCWRVPILGARRRVQNQALA